MAEAASSVNLDATTPWVRHWLRAEGIAAFSLAPPPGSPSVVRGGGKANPDPQVLAAFLGLGAPGSPEGVGIDASMEGSLRPTTLV